MHPAEEALLDNLGIAVLKLLRDDATYRAFLAESEIDLRVASGKLILTQDVMAGGGLVLVPRGRVDRVEGALARVTAILTERPKTVKAMAALFDEAQSVLAAADLPETPAPPSGVTPAPAARAPEATPEPRAAPTPAADDSTPEPPAGVEPAPAPEGDGPPPAEPQAAAPYTGRPEGMPDADNGPHICIGCGNEVDVQQAQVSWVRYPEKLIRCRECFASARS